MELSKEKIRKIEAAVRREEAKKHGFYDGRNAPRIHKDKRKENSLRNCRRKVSYMAEERVPVQNTRPENEGLYDGWGDCSCGKNGPLYKGQCPTCSFARPSLSYFDVYGEGMSGKVPEHYLAVTGWERGPLGDRIVLYGYVHEGRTREGFEDLLARAEKDEVKNLILGDPEHILFSTFNKENHHG